MNEASRRNLNADKWILKYQPFLHKVYENLIIKHEFEYVFSVLLQTHYRDFLSFDYTVINIVDTVDVSVVFPWVRGVNNYLVFRTTCPPRHQGVKHTFLKNHLPRGE